MGQGEPWVTVKYMGGKWTEVSIVGWDLGPAPPVLVKALSFQIPKASLCLHIHKAIDAKLCRGWSSPQECVILLRVLTLSFIK